MRGFRGLGAICKVGTDTHTDDNNTHPSRIIVPVGIYSVGDKKLSIRGMGERDRGEETDGANDSEDAENDGENYGEGESDRERQGKEAGI